VDLCGGEAALFFPAAGREHQDGREKSQKEGQGEDAARPARRGSNPARFGRSNAPGHGRLG